jgi:hypothetical protein
MHVAQRGADLECDDDLVRDDHVVIKDHDFRCWTAPNPDFRISWARAFS